jgi:hypothetical protein
VDNVVVNAGSINLSGSMTAPALTINASGDAAALITVNQTLPALTINGFITNPFQSYAENTTPFLTINASGDAAALIKSDITLPALNINANTPAGTQTDITMPALESTGWGYSSIVSNVSASMPKPVCGGSCLVGSVANAACSMPALECIAETIEGISLTMPMWTGDAAGLTGNVGDINQVLTAMTESADLVSTPLIDGALNFPRPEISSAGLHGTIGDLAVVTRFLRIDAAGCTYRADTENLSLPMLISSCAGYTESENKVHPKGIVLPVPTCAARIERFGYT